MYFLNKICWEVLQVTLIKHWNIFCFIIFFPKITQKSDTFSTSVYGVGGGSDQVRTSAETGSEDPNLVLHEYYILKRI